MDFRDDRAVYATPLPSRSHKFTKPTSINLRLRSNPPTLIVTGFVLLYFLLLIREFDFNSFKEISFSSILFCLLVIAPLAYGVRLLLRCLQNEIRPLIIGGIELITPKSWTSKKELRIPYNDIIAVDTRGTGRHAFHIVQTQDRNLHYSRAAFETEIDWLTFEKAVLSRVGALPDGLERLGRIEAQQRLSKEIFTKIPWATIMLATLCTAIFVVCAAYDQLDLHELIPIGANSAPLVKRGELFRLITSGFIHSGYLHLIFNLTALIALGYLIEIFFGKERLISIFTASLIVGAFCSVLRGSLITLGCSAAVFGLLGAFAVLNLHYHKELPAGLALSKRWWATILGLNLLIPFIIPRIDGISHLGGFLCGAMLAIFWAYHLPVSALSAQRRFSGVAMVGSLALIWLAFITYLYNARDVKRLDWENLFVLNSIVDSSTPKAVELNNFAWEMALEEDVSKAMLELGLKNIDKALQSVDDPNTIDTRATLLYRLGHFNEAAEIEFGLLVKEKDPLFQRFLASQLTRFLEGSQDNQLFTKAHIEQEGCVFTVAAQSEGMSLLLHSNLGGKNYLIAAALTQAPQMFRVPGSYCDPDSDTPGIRVLGVLPGIKVHELLVNGWELMPEVNRYARYTF